MLQVCTSLKNLVRPQSTPQVELECALNAQVVAMRVKYSWHDSCSTCILNMIYMKYMTLCLSHYSHIYISSSIVCAGHSACGNCTTMVPLCYCVWQRRNIKGCCPLWWLNSTRAHSAVLGCVQNICYYTLHIFTTYSLSSLRALGSSTIDIIHRV